MDFQLRVSEEVNGPLPRYLGIYRYREEIHVGGFTDESDEQLSDECKVLARIKLDLSLRTHFLIACIFATSKDYGTEEQDDGRDIGKLLAEAYLGGK